jgi:uncharacterized Zn finger protein
MSYWGYYPPRLTVGKRRAKAAREVKKLEKNGRTVSPVAIDGNKIATTFWGKAWCDNLESYSDFANRLPRGRSYVRHGSVCDLQVKPGRVSALVCGTELYEIAIKIKPLPAETWQAIKAQCAGQIGSLIELLQGKLSKSVMEVVTRRDGGLFPKPREMDMDCSCPDWAGLCKHLAAVLYGVGNRLDHQPELLFTLRQVDHLELIAGAGEATVAAGKAKGKGGRRIAASDLADVFGVDLDTGAAPGPAPATKAEAPAAPTPKPKSRAKKTRAHGREPERPAKRARPAQPAKRART